MPEPIHIISLGAGVQSSTMALMAAKGEITPMPTVAIFADTGDEPRQVYIWLDWLENQLPYPVMRVRMTDWPLSVAVLRARKTADGRNYIRLNIPVFTKSMRQNIIVEDDGKITRLDGFHWEVGKTNRKCTGDAKIEPILKAMRKINKSKESPGIVQWIGISLDEVTRMKESRHKWVEHRYPLVDLRMNRHDCLRWIQKNKFPTPPRSACVYCPFHSDQEWRRLKTEQPKDFARAVAFEEQMIEARKRDEIMKSEPFLHRSCKPLSEIDFSNDEDNGQQIMFQNECMGLCGV